MNNTGNGSEKKYTKSQFNISKIMPAREKTGKGGVNSTIIGYFYSLYHPFTFLTGYQRKCSNNDRKVNKFHIPQAYEPEALLSPSARSKASL